MPIKNTKSKPHKVTNDDIKNGPRGKASHDLTMEPGQSEEFQCNTIGCMACFEILLEPSMVNAGVRELEAGGFRSQTPKHCPFCGKDDIEPTYS